MPVQKQALIILALQISGCFSIATYEIFKGFEIMDPLNETDDYVTTFLESPVLPNIGLISIKELGSINKSLSENLNVAKKISNITLAIPTNDTTTEQPMNTTKRIKVVCPEEERPFNIGPYEVPTQRDLALLTRKTLKRMFGSYHQKALFFLEDIKKATRATMDVESKCQANKYQYKQCVRHVSHQCEAITKGLVVSLERQRHDVAVFSESAVCSLAGLKEDPVKLIKLLAMEEASLEFALPAFLRLLSSCANFCVAGPYKPRSSKPSRHMTDADLVIRHFLTRKNYKQLIFD